VAAREVIAVRRRFLDEVAEYPPALVEAHLVIGLAQQVEQKGHVLGR